MTIPRGPSVQKPQIPSEHEVAFHPVTVRTALLLGLSPTPTNSKHCRAGPRAHAGPRPLPLWLRFLQDGTVSPASVLWGLSPAWASWLPSVPLCPWGCCTATHDNLAVKRHKGSRGRVKPHRCARGSSSGDSEPHETIGTSQTVVILEKNVTKRIRSLSSPTSPSRHAPPVPPFSGLGD